MKKRDPNNQNNHQDDTDRLSLSPHIYEKKVMRLSAMAMVSDGKISNSEKEVITYIILNDYLNETDRLDRLIKGFNNIYNNDINISGADRVSEQNDNGKIYDINTSDVISEALRKKVLDNEQGKEYLGDYYIKVYRYVECIAERLNKPNAQHGLFINVEDMKKDDILDELRECVLVIRSDNIITESERAAFTSYAVIMGVKNPKEVWEELMNRTPEECVKCTNVNTHIISSISINGSKTIEQSITKYDVQGPLNIGFFNALNTKVENLVEEKEQNSKFYSMLASIAFILVAFLLYCKCSVLIETKIGSSEYYDYEKVEKKIPSYENNENINFLVQMGKKNDSIPEYGSPKCTEYFEKGSNYINSNVVMGIWSPWVIGITAFILFIYMFSAYFTVGMYRILGVIELNHIVMIIAVLLCMLMIVHKIATYICISLLVLVMMISIEVLIFMREKYSRKTNNHSQGIVITLVVFAIISDLCIGLIEIPYNQMSNIELVSNKVASSLLLGCISFFSGKFIEVYSMQSQIAISDMKDSIEKIRRFLRTKVAKNESKKQTYDNEQNAVITEEDAEATKKYEYC